MCSCCCWNCCLCFSKNCWCCCWITNCCRACAFWGRGADWVRPRGRCCRSLWMEGESRSVPPRDCAWRGSAPSPERYQSEDNMEKKQQRKKKRGRGEEGRKQPLSKYHSDSNVPWNQPCCHFVLAKTFRNKSAFRERMFYLYTYPRIHPRIYKMIEKVHASVFRACMKFRCEAEQ